MEWTGVPMVKHTMVAHFIRHSRIPQRKGTSRDLSCGFPPFYQPSVSESQKLGEGMYLSSRNADIPWISHGIIRKTGLRRSHFHPTHLGPRGVGDARQDPVPVISMFSPAAQEKTDTFMMNNDYT